jgi:hypothetical protein
MTMAEKPGVIRHAEAQASAVAGRLGADRMAADIGSGNLKAQMTQEF